MYCRVIVGKIVRHGFDLFLHLFRVCAFLQHYKTLSCMFLSRCQIRIFSVSHRFQRALHRDRVLFRIFHAFHSADSVRMPLADSLSPEGIILSFRKDRVGIQSVQGKHSRIPAHGDDPDFAALLCSGIHICKMLRNPRVGVKTVDHIEHLCKLRRLLRQIRSASPAEDHHINLVFPFCRVIDLAHRHSFCQNAHACRIPAGEHCRKFHITVLTDRALHAPSQISIT